MTSLHSLKTALRTQSFFSLEIYLLESGMLTARFIHQDDEGLLMEVDLDVYGLQAVLKVADKFTDRCFVHLQHRSERIVEVRLRAKSSQVPLDSIAGEFCNEALDQRLREIVTRESEPVRNLVLAHALSRVGLANLESESPPPTARDAQKIEHPQNGDTGSK
jgi:His-Xaa-Ser system protein HxsD